MVSTVGLLIHVSQVKGAVGLNIHVSCGKHGMTSLFTSHAKTHGRGLIHVSRVKTRCGSKRDASCVWARQNIHVSCGKHGRGFYSRLACRGTVMTFIHVSCVAW
jgi:hypothetical protein